MKHKLFFSLAFLFAIFLFLGVGCPSSNDDDDDPFYLVGRTPYPGETGVNVSATVRITFSRDVRPDTLPDNFTLAQNGRTNVSGTITYQGSNFTAV